MKGTIRLARIIIYKNKEFHELNQVITEFEGKPYDKDTIFKKALHKLFPNRKTLKSYKLKSIEIDFSKDFGKTLYELDPKLISK